MPSQTVAYICSLFWAVFIIFMDNLGVVGITIYKRAVLWVARGGWFLFAFAHPKYYFIQFRSVHFFSAHLSTMFCWIYYFAQSKILGLFSVFYICLLKPQFFFWAFQFKNRVVSFEVGLPIQRQACSNWNVFNCRANISWILKAQLWTLLFVRLLFLSMSGFANLQQPAESLLSSLYIS